MKKLLASALALLMYVGVPASIDGMDTRTVKQWECEERGEWGSFWWKVERTTNRQSDGHYYYYVYMQSNSYFNKMNTDSTYYKATSYVESPTLIMVEDNSEYDYELKFEYLLFDWEKTYVAHFVHPSPRKLFDIRFNLVSPYSYSKQ